MLVRRFQNSNHMKAEAAVFAKGQRFLRRMPGGMLMTRNRLGEATSQCPLSGAKRTTNAQGELFRF
jgi:hypothetical protein